MCISAIFSCVVCKLLHAVIRSFGRGGTALPGRVALKLCPDILSICSRGVTTLAVTGTNGKTTSVRIVETALRNEGRAVFSNRSGANLMDGIACEFILNTTLTLKPKRDTAVIECDEAACRTVIPAIKPKALLVTNLFRDQLDRYGSVSKPRDCIAEGLRASPETVLCVNADCPMTRSIAGMIPNTVRFFGMSGAQGRSPGSGEDMRCPVCGAGLRYSELTYASLGRYTCRSCGFSRPEPDYVGSPLHDGSFVLTADGERSIIKPALPGMYNAYNALGAAALCLSAGADRSCAEAAASDFECGFGRSESFDLGEAGARMILIKNAAAADQTLELIGQDSGDKCIVFIINARPADGTDISWLGETDMKRLTRMKGLTKLYISGDKAEDAANYIIREKIACETITDYDKLIEKLRDEQSFIYILPTYTAMLDFRQLLVKKLGGKQFWE